MAGGQDHRVLDLELRAFSALAILGGAELNSGPEGRRRTPMSSLGNLFPCHLGSETIVSEMPVLFRMEFRWNLII